MSRHTDHHLKIINTADGSNVSPYFDLNSADKGLLDVSLTSRIMAIILWITADYDWQWSDATGAWHQS